MAPFGPSTPLPIRVRFLTRPRFTAAVTVKHYGWTVHRLAVTAPPIVRRPFWRRPAQHRMIIIGLPPVVVAPHVLSPTMEIVVAGSQKKLPPPGTVGCSQPRPCRTAETVRPCVAPASMTVGRLIRPRLLVPPLGPLTLIIMPIKRLPQGTRVQMVLLQMLQHRHRLNVLKQPFVKSLAQKKRPPAAFVVGWPPLVRPVVPLLISVGRASRLAGQPLHPPVFRIMVVFLVLPLPKMMVNSVPVQPTRHVPGVPTVRVGVTRVRVMPEVRRRPRVVLIPPGPFLALPIANVLP